MLLSLPCGRDKILGILMWLLRRAKQTVDVVLHDERLEGETEAD
jgi:phage gp46-like protein